MNLEARGLLPTGLGISMDMNIYCFLCETKPDKITIGLNKKILGRHLKKYYCIECLAEHLDVTTQELLDKVEDFKSQGCKLFG